MRELFEDISGHSPLDPQESARQSARVPLRKRFYQNAAFTETPDGFAVMLDDKQVRTPSREPLVVPIRTGVGLRLGANIGYLKFTSEKTWNPF